MANFKRSRYTKRECKKLLELREEGKSWKEISKLLLRSPTALSSKYYTLVGDGTIVDKHVGKSSESKELTIVSTFSIDIKQLKEFLPPGSVIRFPSGENWIEIEL